MYMQHMPVVYITISKPTLEKFKSNPSYLSKVNIFWKSHKVWKKSPTVIWHFFLMSKTLQVFFFQFMWPSWNIWTLNQKWTKFTWWFGHRGWQSSMGCNSDICHLEALIGIIISPSPTVITKKNSIAVGKIINRFRELSYDHMYHLVLIFHWLIWVIFRGLFCL